MTRRKRSAMVSIENLRKCSDRNGAKRQKRDNTVPQPGKENETVRVLMLLPFCTTQTFIWYLRKHQGLPCWKKTRLHTLQTSCRTWRRCNPSSVVQEQEPRLKREMYLSNIIFTSSTLIRGQTLMT